MKERFNPKSIARTALAATLPLTTGLSACGDGPTQSGMPVRLETPITTPITAPANPNAEPGRTTLTLTVECQPTSPHSREMYDQEAKKLLTGNTGVVIIEMKGLTCNEKSVTSSGPLAIGRKLDEKNFELIEQFQMYGYSDGSAAVQFITVPSCEGEYSLGEPRPNSNIIDGFLTPDEITQEVKPTFQLYEDCIATIYLGPDTPKDLN